MAKEKCNDIKSLQQVVSERIEYVEIITALQKDFLDPSLIRHTAEGGWTHPWLYFDSVRNYLLLTCFDLLGQPAPYKDFQSWLTADSTQKERVAVLEEAKEGSLLAQIQFTHRRYLNLYGTKVAFYRFINEVLPPDTKRALLRSVMISKIDIENNAPETIDNDDKKIHFLFNTRNTYTHRAVNTGSSAGGVFENFGGPIIDDGVLMWGYVPVKYEEKGKYRFEYSVRRWPDILLETVTIGMQTVYDRE